MHKCYFCPLLPPPSLCPIYLYTLFLWPPPCLFLPSSFNRLTWWFLQAMGGSIGLREQQVLNLWVTGKLEAGGAGMHRRPALSLGANLVGAWYLTSLSSSSISLGAGLNGELKTPRLWKIKGGRGLTVWAVSLHMHFQSSKMCSCSLCFFIYRFSFYMQF